MKKFIFTFLFLFSLSSATLYTGHFIDHTDVDSMPNMREYNQDNSNYYMTQDVEYRITTHLSVPDADRWLAGSIGGPSNIRSGNAVCEGVFDYTMGVSAQAPMGDFVGRLPAWGGGAINTWPNCGSSTYPSCPSGNRYVYWSDSLYANYRHNHGEHSKQLENYGWRAMGLRKLSMDPWSKNEASEVSTIMRGDFRITGFDSGNGGPYTAAGSTPSHSDEFYIWVSSSQGMETVTLTQRLSVDGALIGAYVPEITPSQEFYHAYEGIAPGQSQFTNTIQDDGILYVYDYDNVGIIDPYIAYVDIGSDLGGTYEFAPGQTQAPVTVAVYVPDRPDDFYALSFEFSEIEVDPSSLYSFTPTDLDKDCDDPTYAFVGLSPSGLLGYGQINGGYSPIVGAHSAYVVDLEGDLTVPADMDSGTHQVGFRVCWESCDGETLCGGGDADGCSSWIDIPFEIPEEDTLLPDLICTIEPLEYVTGTDSSDGFEAGEGVQSWRVTVTNIGLGNATIDTDNYLCSAVVFNAYNSDGTSSLDPADFTAEAIFPSALYGTLEPEQSSIVDFVDVPAVCIDNSSNQIEAHAAPNWLAWWYPDCVPYMLEEVEYWNNWCTWDAPCNQSIDEEEPGEEYCVIMPTPQTGYPGSHHEFDIVCYDEGDEIPCSGPIWTKTHGAEYVDAFMGNDIGADVDIITNLVVPEEGDSVIIQAAWSGVYCEGEILLPPMDCFDFI